MVMGLWNDWKQLEADQFLRKYAPIVEFSLLFILISVAIVRPNLVELTWQVVALILLVSAIPYIPLIKRISYGEWDAELETLVQSAEATVEGVEKVDEDSDAEERRTNLEWALNRQLEEDPKMALAKLRMELENVLGKFAVQHGYNRNSEYVQFFEVADFLHDNAKVMDDDLYQDIHQVRKVANEAIHGGEVSRKTAQRIISIGLRVLERIYYEIETEINPDPSIPAFSTQQEDK